MSRPNVLVLNLQIKNYFHGGQTYA